MINQERDVDRPYVPFDELTAITEAAQLDPENAPAQIRALTATPAGCRQLLKMMHEYLERLEGSTESEKADEIRRIMNRFAGMHHFI